MTRKKQSPGQVAAAAARAATQAALQGANDDELSIALGEDEDARELDLLESLAELGEGTEYSYVVTCLSPIDKRGRIETVTRDAIPELPDYLRDRYGPGKYSVQAKGPRGYVKGSHRIITISTLAGKSPAVAAASSATTDWEKFQQRLEEREERRRAEEREERKRRMDLLIAIAPAAIPALVGLLKGGESLTSLTTALVNMKALSGAEGGTEKILEVLTRGMEIGAKANGKEPETMWGVIRETIRDLSGSPVAQSVLDRIANRGAAPAAAAAPVPRIPYQPPTAAPTPAPSAQAPAPVAATGDPVMAQMLPLLNKLADELLEFAENGTDPGLAAEALVAKVPRLVRAMVSAEQLKTWLTLPDWWDRTRAFRPALEPYMAFCDDTRQALYALLVEPAPPAEGEE